MRCMAICCDDYRIFDTVAKARRWAKLNYDALGEKTDVYRMNRDNSMGSFYETTPFEEVD